MATKSVVNYPVHREGPFFHKMVAEDVSFIYTGIKSNSRNRTFKSIGTKTVGGVNTPFRLKTVQSFGLL